MAPAAPTLRLNGVMRENSLEPTPEKKRNESSGKPSPPKVENLIGWVDDGHTTIIVGVPKPVATPPEEKPPADSE
jgi:hypothetical protein